MRYLRILIKLILLFAHVLIGILLCLVFFRNAPRSWFRQHIVPWWLRTIGTILRVRITVHGKSVLPPASIIANHVSWLDIIIIGGLQPTSFLSKNEVVRWPVIGYLARHAGTLFIKRGENVTAAMEMVDTCLQQGISTVIFPEGTTSHGKTVQYFYPRLFASAIDNRTMIQPLAIAYPSRVSPHTINAAVPLKNQKNFMASVFAIMAQADIIATVTYTEPLPGIGERKQVAQQVREIINQAIDKSYER